MFMPIVGFNFSKIDVVRKEKTVTGNISINNNVAIKNIEEADLSIGKDKQDVLKFSFEFNSKYEPEIGNISLGGSLLLLDDSKKIKDILSNWKKDKKIAKEVMAGILNTVLAKCNVQALILSQEVNLPPPIPLPKVDTSKGSKEYIG